MVTAAEKFLKHKKYVIKYFMYLCMHVCMYAYVSLYVMKLNDLSIYFFFYWNIKKTGDRQCRIKI